MAGDKPRTIVAEFQSCGSGVPIGRTTSGMGCAPGASAYLPTSMLELSPRGRFVLEAAVRKV